MMKTLKEKATSNITCNTYEFLLKEWADNFIKYTKTDATIKKVVKTKSNNKWIVVVLRFTKNY